MKKRISLILIFFISINLFSQVINDSQIIQGTHWVYEALDTLSLEQKTLTFAVNSPVNVGELKFYLNKFNKDTLSDNGKLLYDEIENFLYSDSNFLKTEGIKLDLNLLINPEFVYKSNEDINWSYNYYYKDNCLTLPLNTGISNYFSMGGNFFLGKNFVSSQKYNNFTNIPLDFDQIEFLWPRFAYGSLAYISDNEWGINFSINREGKTIGKTKTGSVIMNSTFENDAYIELGIFTNNAKYFMDIMQIQHDKFLYLHEIDILFGKKFKLTAMESALINGPYEIRFLVPTMVYHSYSFWKQYSEPNSLEDIYYNESNCCSYLGVAFEYTPIRNLKLYGLYAMNEIQLPNEHEGKWLSYPSSIGIQAGAEYKLPSKYNGNWIFDIEGVYTTPFMYIKQAPEWSLYRKRQDMITWDYINSWIGTPLGPDCFAINTSIEFSKFKKWSAGINYLFKIHGENDFDIFNNKTEINGKNIYTYYPYTKYVMADEKHENDSEKMKAAIDEGRNLWMSGTNEFTNQITLYGSFTCTRKLELQGQFAYSFIFNNLNKLNNFAHGIELSVAATYKLY